MESLPEAVRLLILQNVSTPNVLTSSRLPPFDFSRRVVASSGPSSSSCSPSPLLSEKVVSQLQQRGMATIDGLVGEKVSQQVLTELVGTACV